MAANNPGIERPLAPAHLQLREPAADKDVSDGKACQGGRDRPAFVSAKAKLALGKGWRAPRRALGRGRCSRGGSYPEDSRSLQCSLSLHPSLR